MPSPSQRFRFQIISASFIDQMLKDREYFGAENEIYRLENIAPSLFFIFDIIIETRMPSLDTLD
jgi:hypothetical protein